MRIPWLTGDSFFQPVTRARPGWRPWLPVWLSLGGLLAVLWYGFHGTQPLEFETALLPDSVRVTFSLDRTRAGHRVWLMRYTNPELYAEYHDEVSAHATYLRYDGTLAELAGELANSPLGREFRYAEWGWGGPTFTSRDGRVTLTVSGNNSGLEYDRTSFVIHSRRTRTPDAELQRHVAD